MAHTFCCGPVRLFLPMKCAPGLGEAGVDFLFKAHGLQRLMYALVARLSISNQLRRLHSPR